MGAIYWIVKGLTANEAIARVSQASSVADWLTPKRQLVLHEYERFQRGADCVLTQLRNR